MTQDRFVMKITWENRITVGSVPEDESMGFSDEIEFREVLERADSLARSRIVTGTAKLRLFVDGRAVLSHALVYTSGKRMSHL